MECRLNQVIIKDNKESYYAYWLLLDCNSNKERKDLLKLILKDPYSSYLFYCNCNPNEFEKQLAIEAILKDVSYCTKLIINRGIADDARRRIIDKILDDPKYSYELATQANLTLEEKKDIYEKYSDIYAFEYSLNEYYKYCHTFKEFICDNEKQLLIDMIIEEQDINKARITLANMKLQEEQIDKLESLILIDTLK